MEIAPPLWVACPSDVKGWVGVPTCREQGARDAVCFMYCLAPIMAAFASKETPSHLCLLGKYWTNELMLSRDAVGQTE